MTRSLDAYWLRQTLPPALCPVASAVTRGDLSEERVGAVLTPARMPWWFLWARHATKTEDTRAGFDFVIYTRDVGRILLQVKNSEVGRAKWEDETRRHGRRYRIHTVVVRPHTPLELVLGRVLAACVMARIEAEEHGCAADEPSLYGAAVAQREAA